MNNISGKCLKKVVALFALVFVGLSTLEQVVAEQAVKVAVDGVQVEFEGQGPVIVDGRTLVLVRGVFEKMGFSVEWNDSSKTATLTRDSSIVAIVQGDNFFIADGKKVTPDVSPQIMNSRFMLPLRAVGEAIPGTTVSWDAPTKTVIILTNSSSPVTTPVEVTPVAITPVAINALPDGAITKDMGTYTAGKVTIKGTDYYLGETKASVESRLGKPIRTEQTQDGTKYFYSDGASNRLFLLYSKSGRVVKIFSNIQGISYAGRTTGDPYFYHDMNGGGSLREGEIWTESFGNWPELRIQASHVADEIGIICQFMSDVNNMGYQDTNSGAYVKTSATSFGGIDLTLYNSWASSIEGE